MKNIRRLLTDNVRTPSIRSLICSQTAGLGYCCEALFFSLYRDVALIAARLGCSERAIRAHRASPQACDHNEHCTKRCGGDPTNLLSGKRV